MKTVFKYPIPARRETFGIVLPINYKFIRVAFQKEQLFLWAEVKKESAMQTYNFGVFGTGHDIPANAKYLTTYDDGPFVFHIYEL